MAYLLGFLMLRNSSKYGVSYGWDHLAAPAPVGVLSILRKPSNYATSWIDNRGPGSGGNWEAKARVRS